MQLVPPRNVCVSIRRSFIHPSPYSVVTRRANRKVYRTCCSSGNIVDFYPRGARFESVMGDIGYPNKDIL
jgi:hypothetical protein